MKLTVKQLARITGTTPRTLHYYDEIGLLRPSFVGDNGYRYYDEAAALRLQQVLFYRELDLSLNAIKAVLDDPDFDLRRALLAHKRALREQALRIDVLLETIDKTIGRLEGDRAMDAEELFGGFANEQEKQWAQEAIEQYGYDNSLVQESARRWRMLTPADKDRIKAEGDAIYRDFAGLVAEDPAGPKVQGVVGRWHAHLGNFCDPGPEVLAGLGRMYADNPDFRATFTAMDPELPELLRDAIDYYVANLP